MYPDYSKQLAWRAKYLKYVMERGLYGQCCRPRHPRYELQFPSSCLDILLLSLRCYMGITFGRDDVDSW